MWLSVSTQTHIATFGLPGTRTKLNDPRKSLGHPETIGQPRVVMAGGNGKREVGVFVCTLCERAKACVLLRCYCLFPNSHVQFICGRSVSSSLGGSPRRFSSERHIRAHTLSYGMHNRARASRKRRKNASRIWCRMST